MVTVTPNFRRFRQAFSLVELLVVLAVLGLLASLLLPALHRAQARGGATVCLQQVRQLQIAWLLYTGDHLGTLPLNDAQPTGGVWRSTPSSWSGPSNARVDASDDTLRQGTLMAYLGTGGSAVFRCPADRSSTERPRTRRSRSYALNGNLAGRTNERQSVIWVDHAIPTPANLLTFIDEHPESIDDGHFLVWSEPDERWVNLPADRHGGLGIWALADGHAEHTRWRHPKSWSGRTDYWKSASAGDDRSDLRRLQRRILPWTDPEEEP
jgi:prepilin-type N-terminal cleavage/methylation domain-containing protein/prepilin-type processing-associated H-X9-DG protein